MNGFRLVARTHPFETRALLLVSVVGLFAATALILRLRAFGIPPECITLGSLDCLRFERAVHDYEQLAAFTRPAIAVLILVGVIPSVLFGLALAAKEIDRGTTAFVWSLTTSRRRWFFARVAPVALLLVVASLAAGLLTDELMAIADTSSYTRFALIGFTGPALPALALALFGTTLVGGAVAGRLLPALIAAVVLGLAGYAAANVLNEHFLRSETIVAEMNPDGFQFADRGRTVEIRVRMPEGNLASIEEAYNRFGGQLVFGAGFDPEELPPGAIVLDEVQLVNPFEILPLVRLRVAALYLAIGLAAIAVGFAVIDRRRP